MQTYELDKIVGICTKMMILFLGINVFLKSYKNLISKLCPTHSLCHS